MIHVCEEAIRCLRGLLGRFGLVVWLDLILLLLFLLVWNSPSLGLAVPHFTQVNTNSSIAERVGLRRAAVLFVRSSETSDEGVKASPSLPERAGAWSWGVWLSKEDTTVQMNLGLSELIQIPKEFKYMVAAALRQ